MLFTDVQRSVRLNKKKKSTNTSPYPDEVIDRLARAFYPAILACWNSEEGQREFAAWQAEQAHHTPSKEKQSVPDCWVSVKQFSKNDTATACQDWLRSTRLGRGSIKSHVRTAKVLAWGFLHIRSCTPLARCNTLDFVAKSCAKGAAPLWNPCSHRLWAMWIRRTESSHEGMPGCLRRGEGTSAEV